MFMDVAIPLTSAAAVKQTLAALYRYGRRWFVTFNASAPPKAKTKVLCLNVDPPQGEFGPDTIYSVHDELSYQLFFQMMGNGTTTSRRNLLTRKGELRCFGRQDSLEATTPPPHPH